MHTIERPRPEVGPGGVLPALRRVAPALTALAVLVTMLAISRDFGATWDERIQQRYGEETWEYLHGERSLDHIETIKYFNNRIYGAFVEVLDVAAQHVTSANVYVVRHAVNAVFGWVGILTAFVAASRLFGRTAGWIAAILLAAMPRYIAESMNNPKDLPFAVLMLAALYFILRLKPRYPYISWVDGLKLALVIALAINVRSMGLVLLGYSGIALLVAGVASRERSPRRWAGTAGRFALLCVTAVAGGTVFWPWAQQQPVVRPVQAFFMASGVSWGVGGIYMGRDLPSESPLPWHYVPVWLAITVPLVVLAGMALSLALSWRRRESRLQLAAIWGFVLLPATFVVARHLTLYDGIRHIYFIVPPLAVIAGVGWADALATRKARIRLLAAALLVVGVAEPLLFQVRNHPNQAVYFSPIIGGPRGAFGRFEMDYWGNSMQAGVAWSAAQAHELGMPVGVSGSPWEVVAADASRYSSLFFTLPYRPGYHLNIQLLRGTRLYIMNAVNRQDIVHRVTTADGTPLCLVTAGPEYRRLVERRATLPRPSEGSHSRNGNR